MKLIFLDIDGVLNSWEHSIRISEQKERNEPLDDQWEEAFDPYAIERLNNIIEETGALVVISSTWRMTYGSAYLEYIFNKLDFRGKIVGATLVLRESGTKTSCGRYIQRGYEIDNWLKALEGYIESYVIIDDDNDMTEEQQDYYIKTECSDGLQDSHVGRAIDILNCAAKSS